MNTNQHKPTSIIPCIIISLLSLQAITAQQVILQTDEVQGDTQIAKEDFPSGNLINMVHGWGGMTVAINEPAAGTDYSPLLQGLKDDLCQVPHWGYLEKGKIRIIDKQGSTSLVEGGSVFYMPPGHTLVIEEDARIIDFSPEKQMKELNEFVAQKVAKMKGK